MSFEQTRHVISRARNFHKHLSEFYHKMECVTEKTKVKQLLHYLSRHEKTLENNLARFSEDTKQAVLNTWFKYTPAGADCEGIELIPLHPGMSIEEVVEIALEMNNDLLNLYREMAAISISQEVTEVFEDLYRLTINDKKQLFRNVQALNGLSGQDELLKCKSAS